jgi:hypothetical protein
MQYFEGVFTSENSKCGLISGPVSGVSGRSEAYRS